MKNSTDVSSKLYEVLGIIRMIGALEISDDPGQRLHDLEAATWAARGAETILTSTIELIED